MISVDIGLDMSVFRVRVELAQSFIFVNDNKLGRLQMSWHGPIEAEDPAHIIENSS